jgi:hypothetical protein
VSRGVRARLVPRWECVFSLCAVVIQCVIYPGAEQVPLAHIPQCECEEQDTPLDRVHVQDQRARKRAGVDREPVSAFTPLKTPTPGGTCRRSLPLVRVRLPICGEARDQQASDHAQTPCPDPFGPRTRGSLRKPTPCSPRVIGAFRRLLDGGATESAHLAKGFLLPSFLGAISGREGGAAAGSCCSIHGIP